MRPPRICLALGFTVTLWPEYVAAEPVLDVTTFTPTEFIGGFSLLRRQLVGQSLPLLLTGGSRESTWRSECCRERANDPG